MEKNSPPLIPTSSETSSTDSICEVERVSENRNTFSTRAGYTLTKSVSTKQKAAPPFTRRCAPTRPAKHTSTSSPRATISTQMTATGNTWEVIFATVASYNVNITNVIRKKMSVGGVPIILTFAILLSLYILYISFMCSLYYAE